MLPRLGIIINCTRKGWCVNIEHRFGKFLCGMFHILGMANVGSLMHDTDGMVGLGHRKTE